MPKSLNNLSNPLQYARAGIGNQASYLVSGVPYITGSTLLSSSFATDNAQVKVGFPLVAREVETINTGEADLRIHYNSIAEGNVISGSHFITIPVSGSQKLRAKCKEIYVSLANSSADGSFEMFAELTTINAQEMYALTGSGLTD
jgi:hypothetical protein